MMSSLNPIQWSLVGAFFLLGGLVCFQMVVLAQFQKELNTIDSERASQGEALEVGPLELSPETQDELQGLLYEFVDRLAEYTKNEARYQESLAFLETFVAEPIWAEHGLALAGGGPVYIADTQVFSMKDADQTVVTLTLENDGHISATSYKGDILFLNPESTESIRLDIEKLLNEALPSIYESISAVEAAVTTLQTLVFSNERFQGVLAEKRLTLEGPVMGKEMLSYKILNADLRVVSHLNIHKDKGSLWLEELALPEGEAAVPLIAEQLEALDTRTELEILVAQRVEDIEATFTEKSFKKALRDLQWSVGEPVESDERVSFPIYDEAGMTLRLIYVDKSNAEVKVEWPGVSAEPLALATEHLLSKKKVWISPAPFLSMVS